MNLLKSLMATVALVFLAGIVRAADTDPAVQAWQELTNISLPTAPMEWNTNPPSQDQLAKFDDAEEAAASAKADKASQFYLNFPGDTNASDARLIEVGALQAAVHYGATNREGILEMRELSIAADTNMPEQIRYQLRLDEVGRELKADDASGANMNDAEEKVGRELIKEYPDGPAGYELLEQLAISGDLLKMHDLAKVMADSGGPKELTGQGTALLNQINIVGQPLPLQFTASDGRQISTATLSNKVVMVDFWATWCPPCVESIPQLVRLYGQYHTNGLEIVGINFDDDTNSAEKCISSFHMTWPQYFGGYGVDNRYGQEYGETLPYVWLVDKKGIVQDIHGRVDTEAKIQKLLAE
jgi:thiol-disulfide isomerase/thioredoxin